MTRAAELNLAGRALLRLLGFRTIGPHRIAEAYPMDGIEPHRVPQVCR